MSEARVVRPKGTVAGALLRELGLKGLAELLQHGYDQGLRFFDAADQYGSHPHVAEALKHVPRDKVVVLTKTRARGAENKDEQNDLVRRIAAA